jgi:hypothetical protein
MATRISNALLVAMEQYDPACLHALTMYMEQLYVPCVDWVRGAYGWIVTVHLWDAYCDNVCEEVTDYLVCLHHLGLLQRVDIICTYQDSLRCMYDGSRIQFDSEVPSHVMEAVTRPELIGKTILVYKGTEL